MAASPTQPEPIPIPTPPAPNHQESADEAGEGEKQEETTETEESPDSAGRKTDADSDSDPDSDSDSDSDSEEEIPQATLMIESDAPGVVNVKNLEVGTVSPEEPLEVDVDADATSVVVVAVEVPAARWNETLDLEEGKVLELSVPMLETIEKLRRVERREKVFRVLDDSLMWAKQDNGRDIRWQGANLFCEESKLGGWQNWRLPTRDELESLEAVWSPASFKTLGGVTMTECCQWSSTSIGERRVWVVNFRFRRAFDIDKSLSFGYRALCIREMEAEELEEALIAADPKVQKAKKKERERRLAEKKKRQLEKKARKAQTDGDSDTTEDENEDG